MRMPLIEDDLDIVSFIRFGFKEAALLSTWPSEVDKDPKLRADFNRMSQVMSNLLDAVAHP